MENFTCKRVCRDENAVADRFWREGFPAVRIPAGGGRFAGHVLAFTPNCVKIILVQRGGGEAVFPKELVQDAWNIAGRVARLVYPNSVSVELKAYFPKQRRWIEKMLLNWDGEDVRVQP